MKEILGTNNRLEYASNCNEFHSFVINQKEINLDIYCQEDSHVELFLMNQSEDCTLNVHVECKGNSYCKIGLLDLQDAPLIWNQETILKEEGAEFEIYSAQLCQAHGIKKGTIEVKHEAAHTYGQIQNYAVLSENANYEMWANGNIEKGCVDAQSHQKTRVLTLGKGHNANVTPLLLISENQVKASHALSIGQPNEEQLYYLQSRGLTKQQALGLLSVGYFLPIIQMVPDQDQQIELQKEMEQKVGLYGCK